MVKSGLLQLGLIGAGRWGRNFINTIKRIDGMELVAIVSENSETRNFANESIIYPHWNDLLKLGLDGVIIATPPKYHYEMGLPFLKNKIPLIIEKPLCLSVKDAIKLKNIALKNGVFVLIDHTQLFNPAFIKLKEIKEQYGKINYIHAEGMNFGPFRQDVSVLWDWSPHEIAMCLDFLQEPIKNVKAVGDSSHLSIFCESESGVKISILNSNLSSEKRRKFEVFFDKRLVVLNGLTQNKISDREYLIEQDTSKYMEFRNEIHHNLQEILSLDNVLVNFAEGIRSKSPDFHSLDIAVEVIRVLEAAERSLSESKVTNL